MWATGAYCSTDYYGDTFKPILAVLQATEPGPIPFTYTVGANYSEYSMWVEDSGSDLAGNIYGLVNVYGYNHDTSAYGNNYTVAPVVTIQGNPRGNTAKAAATIQYQISTGNATAWANSSGNVYLFNKYVTTDQLNKYYLFPHVNVLK